MERYWGEKPGIGGAKGGTVGGGKDNDKLASPGRPTRGYGGTAGGNAGEEVATERLGFELAVIFK